MARRTIQRIGVMTSGGDCAGLNAVIRAVVFRAIQAYDWEVYGITDGTLGLMNRPLLYQKLDLATFSGPILRMGGTMLGTTNRGNPFAYPMPDGTTKDRTEDFAEGVRELGLDAIVVIGGDGSMRIVSQLCHKAGVPMIGIPKTIDNDVAHTDTSVGFSTAVAVCVDALDRLQPTAASHHRVMILEVMGRDAGHICLHTAISGGADAALVPEIPYTIDGLAGALHTVLRRGRRHAMVVVAEGVRGEDGGPLTVTHQGGEVRYGGVGQYLSAQLSSRLDIESRVTVLGHVQRGGTPDPHDRMLASAFGVHAVDILAAGRHDRMVAWQNRGIAEVPIDDVVAYGARGINPHGPTVRTAQGLGIYVGEPEQVSVG